MKKTNLISMLMMVAALVFYVRCEETTDETSNSVSPEITETAEDDAMADEIFEEIDAEVEADMLALEAKGYDPGKLKSANAAEPDCVVITVAQDDSARFPKTVTFDYGDGCKYTRRGFETTKKGKVMVTISNRMIIPGSTRTITFDDYYVNEFKVEGTRKITNKGINSLGNLEAEITVTDGKLIFNNQYEYTRNATKTKEWVRASNALNDTVFISFSMSGNNFADQDYTRQCDKLVVVRCENATYRWVIVEGLVNGTVNNNPFTIDFGDGTCNNTIFVEDSVGRRAQIEVRHRAREKYRKIE
ncbi:MAG: hypothetical protein HC896_01965 [Bacteroidales bacterium]|nr:hypothetical protein [Bacteroidales bacterium]